MHSLAEKLIEDFIYSLESENNLNMTDYSDVALQQNELNQSMIVLIMFRYQDDQERIMVTTQ